MLLRGIRWRLGPSLLMVLIAAIAVGAAVLGPLYLRAAGDSLVRSAVAAAPAQDDGITITPKVGSQLTLQQLESEQTELRRQFGLDRWYAKPITTVATDLRLSGPRGAAFAGQLLYRTGICRYVKMQTGSCNVGPHQILASTRTAKAMHLKIGSTVPAVVSPNVNSPGQKLLLHVTGIYQLPSDDLPYWWGDGAGFFAYGTPGPDHAANVDAFISTEATALNFTVKVPAYELQLPLRKDAVGLQDHEQLQQALVEATDAARPQQVAITSPLPTVLAGATQQQHQMTTIVAIAAIQLVLLAVWVLAALLLRGADLRRSELRVARLRGFTFASVLAVTVIEPAILCLSGAVIGVIAAWIGILIAKDALLFPTTTMSVGIWVIAAFAAVTLTVAGVLLVSALRVLREPASNQISASADRSSNRGQLIADAGLLVLSVVALVALESSGALASHDNPIASAAPGLLALGTAVVAVRLVLLVCRRATPMAARAGRVSSLLAFRLVVSRPALIRQARVLIVALCLACFATCAWSVARTNRQTAAEFTVGAPTVVKVTPGRLGLQQAVAKADPGGHYAMAAIQIKSSSSSLMAVDATRLAAVASWPNGITHASIEQVARALQPRTVPQINLAAGRVAVTAGATGNGGAGSRLQNLDLALWVFNPQAGTNIVTIGALRPGVHRYSGSLSGWCPGGCRLAGIGFVPAGRKPLPRRGAIDLSLQRLGTAGQSPLPAANLTAAGWRSDTSGVQVQPPSGAGVSFVINANALGSYEGGALGSITPPMAAVADHPVNLPGVVTRLALFAASQSGGATSVSTQGLDGNTVSVAATIPATALPRVGNNAELVDLTQLQRTQIDPSLPEETTDEVWLGAAAPGNALAKLQAAGLRINGVEQTSHVYASLEHSGPAFAYDFMLFATIVALLVAAASTLGVLGSATRQRAAELTALEVAGIGRRRIVRTLIFESGILALTALFGAAAGAVGAAMAIPSLPELSKSLVAPLSYTLPALLIVLVAVCVVAVVAAVTAITGTEILRRMSPTILRTAPDDTES